MHTAKNQNAQTEIEARFASALPYFKERGGVIFISYCRFWEPHAFVQQSLAKYLVKNGVDVTWLDGAGWRPYRPTLYFNSPHLKVTQLPELPGRRIDLIAKINTKLQASFIRSRLRQRNPVLWVQGGIDESLAEELPYIDVLSLFDDPYRHPAGRPLYEKAKLVLCQNSYTYDLFGGKKKADSKVKLALPPVDMAHEVFDPKAAPLALPKNFPKQVMGYLGSFFPSHFDMNLLETFVRLAPDWGFLLMGRTDAAGQSIMRGLSRHRNFHYLPWVPRAQLAQAWQRLKVSLLLYRPCRAQDGAFPTKVLESTYFEVPSVATRIPKTLDLEGYFPRCEIPEVLIQQAITVAGKAKSQLGPIFDHFSHETNPQLYLAKVAEFFTK